MVKDGRRPSSSPPPSAGLSQQRRNERPGRLSVEGADGDLKENIQRSQRQQREVGGCRARRRADPLGGEVSESAGRQITAGWGECKEEVENVFSPSVN